MWTFFVQKNGDWGLEIREWGSGIGIGEWRLGIGIGEDRALRICPVDKFSESLSREAQRIGRPGCRVGSNIERLRDRGMEIEVRDCGSGNSSFVFELGI